MRDFPIFEFHVSREARDRYGFAETLFSLSGNVVFANISASREFAQRMNDKHPEWPVNPGALNAMGLIDEALHLVIALYRERRDPQAVLDALAWYERRLGRDALDRTLLAFVEQFPPAPVYQGKQTSEEWLIASTNRLEHRAIALEELMMLWLANLNPAFKLFSELFDEKSLVTTTSYPAITITLREYFETRPRFGPEGQNLVDMLRAPALASPDSLEGQLAFIHVRWADLLGDFLQRLVGAMDILKEEQIAVWMRFHPPGGHFGGPTFGDSSVAAIPQFSTAAVEYEKFSPDVDWMTRTVLIAKTVYVWLNQLSTRYRRPIATLDQVPDDELDTLARRGFNALWLIGIWERSRASQRIKQMMGNPEAAASAYSLEDYVIAADLGGELAYANLRQRAWNRGIRLASDMVPNHMGIDSRWVREHPRWFLSLPKSPFPAYSFNGPDVSSDERVEIKVEDHYYDRSDAAVVFRRRDRWTGDTAYIYHGNDGTSFPWNDTAQLNYLQAEVREAVIQTILHVARQFPIIRFDAAMTLTKQHYQRLWFPAPGTGGAIPSRAEHGLTKAAFDAAMPAEFWREVVDRVADEVPGTLLLAEAFWLLEGYFVRTLGMHRVYNSAFMNMLRDEENANYRTVLKNTLEFDPEVLKRYVNFMNNPDERTAVDQFGRGDKYFGVCTLLATLPGLPMFGHGQVEGLGERYGMEYRRAYQDETPDAWLIARHERDIAPLLHRRPLFAEVCDFLLYDFFTDEGRVNEDAFAYSNRLGEQRALVVYNNRYASTSGWVRVSCAYAEKQADGGKRLRQRTLGESFGLSENNAASMFVAYRDTLSGLEYLRRTRDIAEQGIHVELGAYKCSVMLDWRNLRDDHKRPWGALCDELGGRGVSSLDDELVKLELRPVHDSLRALLDPASAYLAEYTAQAEAGRATPEATDWITLTGGGLHLLLERAGQFLSTGPKAGGTVDVRRGDAEVVAHFEKRLSAAQRIPLLEPCFSLPWPREGRAVLPSAQTRGIELRAIWSTVLAWCVVESLGKMQDAARPETAALDLFDRLRLREPLAESFVAALASPTLAPDVDKSAKTTSISSARSGIALVPAPAGHKPAPAHDVSDEQWRAAARIRAAFYGNVLSTESGAPASNRSAPLYRWLHDPDVAWLIGVNEHQGVRYVVKEQFERLLWWMVLPKLLELAASPTLDREAVLRLESRLYERMKAAAASGYRVEALFE